MKSLLLLIILMFQAFILHAQTETIDGFELGGSRDYCDWSHWSKIGIQISKFKHL